MDKNRIIVPGTSPHEDKILAIFERCDNKVKIYTMENGKSKISLETFNEYRKKPRDVNTPYVLVYYNSKQYSSLKEQCKYFTKTANTLYYKTKGKINMFRTGTVKKTILQLFFDLCNPEKPTFIQYYEAIKFEKCRGALVYGTPYFGMCWKYDFVSHYPALMASAQQRYPMDVGTLKTITNEEFDEMRCFKYGLYHVEVFNTDKRVWVKNYDHWYTHTDLNFANDHLKYKMRIIQDGKPNALLYDPSSLVSGRDLFGPLVKYLFKYKKEGVKEVKIFLNTLWGALCQTNKWKSEITNDTKEYKQGNNFLTYTIKNGKVIADCVNVSNFYDTNFARIKPFLLSFGRIKTAKVILKNIDNVVRINTDGFILTEPIKDYKTGTDLGELKFEGSSVCRVLNSQKVIWGGETLELLHEMKCNMELIKKMEKDLGLNP